MRKTVIAAVTALSLAGAAGGAAVAFGQPMPPPSANGPGMNVPPPPGPGPDGPRAWMHRMWRMRMQNRPFAPGTFALFDRRVDRQLGPQDVQVIAQGILLWNGNHTWRVNDIEPGPNDTIKFAYTAPDGTPIARFAINVHTGRIIRAG